MEKDADQVRREAETGPTGEKVAAPDPVVAAPEPEVIPAASASEQGRAQAKTEPQAQPQAQPQAKPQAKAPPPKDHVLDMSARERAGQGGPIEVAGVLILVAIGIIGVLVILFGGG
ncbi:MAG: hypothetical protein HC829_02880 [Bacteroidales bacterium]|nr:hypothetical protein [Bacteroidales bacterium]